MGGNVDLWVSIVSCPSPGLCIPSFATANITAAFDAGSNASGIVDPQKIWFGGHSLGGVAADYHVSKFDGGVNIQGGALIWGDYIFEGPQKMVDYPVPVLSLLGELNFGSARPMKMAPYFAAVDAAGEEALKHSPVVVVKDIDHSDMCEGFHVEGDLPSALDAAKAIDSIADLSATFMMSQIVKDQMSQVKMNQHIEFTRDYMKPMNAALAFDSHSASWCEQMQHKLAEPFANQISVKSVYNDSEWQSPTAEISDDGKVAITVTGLNVYENKNAFVWPPSDPWPFLGLLRSNAVPAVDHNTPTTQGCRLVSRSKIAELLGHHPLPEPDDFCKKANEAAWQWSLTNALPRTLLRYKSKEPCNGCSPAATISFKSDDNATISDFTTFVNSSLSYDLGNGTLVVQSPVFLSEDEHSCMLLSPSHAFDFLVLEAYLASTYQPEPIVMV